MKSCVAWHSTPSPIQVSWSSTNLSRVGRKWSTRLSETHLTTVSRYCWISCFSLFVVFVVFYFNWRSCFETILINVYCKEYEMIITLLSKQNISDEFGNVIFNIKSGTTLPIWWLGQPFWWFDKEPLIKSRAKRMTSLPNRFLNVSLRQIGQSETTLPYKENKYMIKHDRCLL